MLKKILLTAIACHLLTFALYAQTRTNEPVLRKTAESEREIYIRNMTRVRQLAQEKGWPTSFTTPEGRRVILVGVDMFGLPLYTGTDNNSVAAATVGANQLWNGGVSGLNLSGSSNSVVNKMALWDGGRVLLTHQELAGRVTLRDGSPNNSDHSTHVAGTMIATGINANAKGMAYGAQGIYAYDYDNHLSEMSGEAANLLLSNHSYGTLAGWQFNNSRWEFYGAPGDNEDYKFGYYSFDAQMFDSIAYNAPY
ncbi:MAG TPA: hypothetical protein VFZ78_03505, partial [Flavisolibacter sp.]